jgi:hypothetical protein
VKFRKKPIVIEAEQFFVDKPLPPGVIIETYTDGPEWGYTGKLSKRYYVATLEGPLNVSDGDWIIKGIKGEFYPCKPDIFELTYEAVNE